MRRGQRDGRYAAHGDDFFRILTGLDDEIGGIEDAGKERHLAVGRGAPEIPVGGGAVGLDGALRLANATLGSQVRWAPRGGKWQLLVDGGMTVVRRLEYARGGDLVADLAPGNVPYLRLGAQRLF